MPGGFTMPEGFDESQMPGGFTPPEGFTMPEGGQPPQEGTMPDTNWGGGGGGFGGGGFGGNSETTLQYTDDDPDSYSAIFDNAAFSPDTADKNRLIDSLKTLSEGSDKASAIDAEEVLRYFVVHNFTLNADSYTGSIIHNYYLYEEDGKLAMIPWDYNLAFGGMGGMGGGGRGMGGTSATDSAIATDSATALVNYPIDTPTLGTSSENLPMLNWILESEAYTARYHELFAEFMEYFSSGAFAAMYDNAVSLIAPYVEKDPTAFCTYDEFTSASATLRTFCTKRAESIALQLSGTIASTSDGQTESANANFIDASTLDVASMGSQNMGFSGARGGMMGGGMRE
jgi:spore coat protein CotH